MCSSVADPSDGPRDPAPLLFLAPDEVQRDEKKIFKTPPHLIRRSGSATALAFNIFVNPLTPSIHTRILESDFLHFVAN